MFHDVFELSAFFDFRSWFFVRGAGKQGHVESLVWQTLIITPVDDRSEWSGLVNKHFDVRAAVNGDDSDDFCVHEIGCLFNDAVLDERARAFKTALLGSLGKRVRCVPFALGITHKTRIVVWSDATQAEVKVEGRNSLSVQVGRPRHVSQSAGEV